ncbi:hypothetical protein ACFLSF_00980 [Candidatus Bipolaricaulota bacterium]
MFGLTLNPVDTTTAKHLAKLQQQRLARCIHARRTRPPFRLDASLSVGRLQLAASCTLHSTRSAT